MINATSKFVMLAAEGIAINVPTIEREIAIVGDVNVAATRADHPHDSGALSLSRVALGHLTPSGNSMRFRRTAEQAAAT